MTAPPDASTTYADAAATVADVVTAIADDRWTGPGLGAWDLRALVGHTSRAMVTVLTYLDRPARSEDVAGPEAYFALLASRPSGSADAAAVRERGRQAGEALGDHPAAAFRDLVDRAVARVAAAHGDELVETIAGGMRVEAYLPTRTVELVVHGLDVAAAADVRADFSAAALNEAAGVLVRAGVGLGHGPALLAAFTGRAALPTGFSLV